MMPAESLTFNGIRSIRHVKAGEPIIAEIGPSAYGRNPAPENGYVLVLVDSTVFVPTSALRKAQRKKTCKLESTSAQK